MVNHRLMYQPHCVSGEWLVVEWELNGWKAEARFYGPWAQENAFDYLKLALKRDADV